MRKFLFSYFWCALFIAMSIGVSNAQENNQYKWLHQTPQGNNLRWVKMWDANNWYAAGYGGTFMKTTNAGVSWNILNNIYTDNTGGYVRIYDAYFVNMNTGWAGGDAGKIMKTTNGGNIWDTSIVAVSPGATWYGLYFLNANTGFASGSPLGRVAKTTDGGATWTQVGTPPSATYYSIYAKDVNNIIASTINGNIRKTTDGGATWNTISTGSTSILYKVNFLDANTGYVCGSANAIRYTTDFGDTWTSTNTGVTGPSFYDIDFSSMTLPGPTLNYGFEPNTWPPNGWSVVSSYGTVQWTRSLTNPYAGVAAAYCNFQSTGGIDWLTTTANAVFTSDSLSFWLRRSYTGTSFDWDSLQVWAGTSSDTSAMTKMLSIGVNNLIDTTGNSYPPRPGDYKRYAVNMSSFAGQNVFIAFRHSNHDGTGIRMDNVKLGENRPANQTNVYITGNESNIYKSAVGLNAFDTLQIFDPSQPFTSVFYGTDLNATGDTILAVGSNGIINKRNSPSNRVAYTNFIKAGILFDIWGESSTGRVIAVGAPATAGVVYDQVMYSTNGGVNWALGDFSATNSEDLNSISMVNAMTGYVVGDEGGVHKTTDGGVTWSPTALTGTTTDLEKAVFLNVNTGYVFGEDGNNHKTTDGGATWTPYVWGAGTSDVYSASFIDVNTGWVAGQSGNLYKTTNGGATTTSQDAGVGTAIIYSMQMINANTGWLSSISGMVRRTTDGGNTWDTCDVPFSVTINSVYFVDQFNGIAAGLSGRIYRTRDGGNTWESNNTSASTLYRAYMTSTNRAFVCGGSGNIWKYEEDLTGTAINFTNNVPEKYYLDQNYPNPFNPSTTIKFGLPREGAVTLRIYDMAGREVAKLVNNERMNAGIVSYNFNGNALASGVYFYTLVVDNNLIATKKMVLVK